MSMSPRQPVLIGGGQRTWRTGTPPGPLTMLQEVAGLAAADAGLPGAALAGVDTLAVVGFTIDAPDGAQRLPVPRVADPPAALAERLGCAPKRAVYTHMGGNTPQALVNWACEEIAEGRADLVLLTGAEFLGGLMKAATRGGDLSVYGGGPDTSPERWGDPRPGCTPQEAAHGIGFPANTYPMFENALRAHLGRSPAAHAHAISELFAPFSAVAAQNPHAWFPTARSAEELRTVSPDNRMVGYPYPKYLNAIIQVDQAAAVLLASAEAADRLGIAQDKRVYLHGCADTHELWNPIDRVDFHSSPAIRTCGQEALSMAGATIADIGPMDVYSCFPVAVELACRELDIDPMRDAGLTLTGGLPYFGGPGNNYSMHAIVEMLDRCRAKPTDLGLVTANGWFLTKHAMGVYSATPPKDLFARTPPKTVQARVDALKGPAVVPEPDGPARIEAYTVVHGREGYRMGIVYGRDQAGRRFVANTPDDQATLAGLESGEAVGRTGVVTSAEGGMKNLFTPDPA